MKRWGCLALALTLLLGCCPLPAAAVELSLPVRGAVLMDAATGTVLYEQNSHAPLPPASVTKIMTLLLVMEAIRDGRLHWEDPVSASATAAGKGGSQIYLKEGEVMTVRTLVKAVAVSSANDAACALAEQVCGTEAAFVDAMNLRAQQLGMKDTHFVNCTGLDDDPREREHLTSAYDIALMSRELITKHPVIREYTTIWTDTVRDGTFGLANTNKLIRYYDGATGLKTGYTSRAGFCLSATAQRDGLELIAVALGADSSQDRFQACKAMLDHGFATYALAVPQTQEPVQVAVKLGTQARVSAVLADTTPLLVLKSQRGQLRFSTQAQPELTAPVSRGQRLGTLTVYSGEQVLAQLPLVAEQSVPRLGYWEIFCRLLGQICFCPPAAA